MRNRRFAVLLLVSCLAIVSGAVAAETFRWSSANDITTLDPHANPDAFSDGVLHDIYDRLAVRDRNFNLVPALATRWQQVNPTTLRFFLRPDVRFHDGSILSADDVVFSLERVRRPSSDHKEAMAGVKNVVKVDAMTVDVVSEKPMAPLLAHVTTLAIMSKAWLLKHGAAEPHDYAGNKESYTGHHAMGTGPFRLKSFEPGAKLVLEPHREWWSKREGNASEVVFRPIKSNATRMAALLSGEVDLVLDPPPQDLERLLANPQFKVDTGPEHRVIFLSFNVVHNALRYGSAKGGNPFQDRRVREAISLAIDREALRSKVLRGVALPTGTLVPQGVVGHSAKAAAVPAPDLARAKRLMQDAGYAQGFKVTLDCSNDREQLCTALAAMISKLGVELSVNATPRAVFFPRINPTNRDVSLFLSGMGAVTGDATMLLESLLHTFRPDGRGANNSSGVSSSRYDELLATAGAELDPAKRNALFEQLQLAEREENFYVPLYQPLTPWVMRRGLSVTHRPDNYLDLRWVRMERR